MTNMKTTIALGIVIALAGGNAFAAQQSTASSKSFLDNIYSTHWSDITSDDAVDADGNETINTEVYNSAKLGAKLGGDVKAFVNPRYMWYPSRTEPTEDNFEFLNLRLGVQKSNIYKNGIFNFSVANLVMEMRTSQGARNQDLVVAPASNQHFSLSPENSRFTLGNYSRIRGYIYGGVGDGSDRNLVMGYVYPYVSYKISPSVDMNLFYMAAASIKITQTGETYYSDDSTYFQPTLYWDAIPKRINVGPFVRLHRDDGLSIGNFQAGFELLATLL